VIDYDDEYDHVEDAYCEHGNLPYDCQQCDDDALADDKAVAREARRHNRTKMRVSGRSVFELQRLRARPLKPRRRDTRRGPTSAG
jgi:hypothetical protein